MAHKEGAILFKSGIFPVLRRMWAFYFCDGNEHSNSSVINQIYTAFVGRYIWFARGIRAQV